MIASASVSGTVAYNSIRGNLRMSGVQDEVLAASSRQADPAGHQDSSQMAVRKQRNVTVQTLQSLYQLIDASRDLIGRFTVRAPFVKQV